jgi:hypothetical protein
VISQDPIGPAARGGAASYSSISLARWRACHGTKVPRSVTIESFPETVYTEVPTVRRYRYFRHDDDVMLVDPEDDRIVDIIR